MEFLEEFLSCGVFLMSVRLSLVTESTKLNKCSGCWGLITMNLAIFSESTVILLVIFFRHSSFNSSSCVTSLSVFSNNSAYFSSTSHRRSIFIDELSIDILNSGVVLWFWSLRSRIELLLWIWRWLLKEVFLGGMRGWEDDWGLEGIRMSSEVLRGGFWVFLCSFWAL